MTSNVFDLTKHITNKPKDDHYFSLVRERIECINNEIDDLQVVMENAYDLHVALLESGRTECAKKAISVWKDLTDEHSYLCEEYARLISG